MTKNRKICELQQFFYDCTYDDRGKMKKTANAGVIKLRVGRGWALAVRLIVCVYDFTGYYGRDTGVCNKWV